MPQADVSSLVEVSVAFNFAYAFIRGLSTFEISRREEKCAEIYGVADRLVTEEDRRATLMNEKRYFDLCMKRAHKNGESRIVAAIRLCSLVGFLGIAYLFLTGMGIVTIPNWLKGVSAATFISTPFLAILALKISLKDEMKEADRRFVKIRDIALGW